MGNQRLRPEDQGEPRGADWWIWPVMGVAMLGAIAGVIGSLAALFSRAHAAAEQCLSERVACY